MARPKLMGGENNAAPPSEDPDTEVFETMVASLRELIFGENLTKVQDQLAQSESLPIDIATMVTLMVVEASKQAGDKGIALTTELVFGVATEIIDDLIDIAVAMGKLQEADVTDQFRQECLMQCVAVYGDMETTSPEDKEMAKAQLAEMANNGDLEEGTKYIAQEGEKVGVDPFAQGGQAGPAAGGQAPPAAGQRPQLMG